jgi:hypothetical protein
MYLAVIEAKYINDLKLSITFSDNKTQVVDFRPWLEQNPHPQHDKYREPNNFKQFYIDHGNVVWGENWDLDFHILNLYNNDLSKDVDY